MLYCVAQLRELGALPPTSLQVSSSVKAQVCKLPEKYEAHQGKQYMRKQEALAPGAPREW